MTKIDLSKYKLRTDLIIEDTNIKHSEKDMGGIKIIKTVNNGNYYTISFKDITNYEDREKVGECLEKVIKEILKKNKIKDDDSCLIVGLGNANSTPDSLGTKTIDNILVTAHLFLLDIDTEGLRKIYTFKPNVMANTGMESADTIIAITKKYKPNFIILIDSLAAGNIDRVNRTIQITDTGIHPGSGIGNNRKEINKKRLGIPVIAIGVPTVIYASTIIYNTTPKYTIKELDDSLLDLIVTPSEIDFVIDKLANLISSSLNNALNRQITHY